MPLLHSAAIADITFGCKTLTEKDFVSKLRKSTYINVSDPCKHKHLYGAFVVRGNAEDLWTVPTQCEGFYAAFVTVNDIGRLRINFAPPYTGTVELAMAFLQHKCDQM